MVFSKTLYKGTSEYATLKVQKKRGTINLISGKNHLQSSYRPGKKPVGTVWDYFLVAPLFAQKPNEVKDVCILGLGAGVAVKLLNRVYKIERIIGVEIDKVVVDLGRKFFGLNDDNLEIHIQDAAEYAKESSERPACRQAGFDLILIDTFKDDAVDPRCSCPEFYSDVIKLLKPGGVVLVNRANTQSQEEINKRFRLEFPPLFAQCYTLTVRNNVFYFGLQKPLQKQKIIARLKNFTKGFRGRSEVLKTTNEVCRLR